MKELKLYYDVGRTKEIIDKIVFEPLIAGKTTQKTIYLYNDIIYPLTVSIKLSGAYIDLVIDVKELQPKETKPITFEFNPVAEIGKPLSANLKIDILYTIT